MDTPDPACIDFHNHVPSAVLNVRHCLQMQPNLSATSAACHALGASRRCSLLNAQKLKITTRNGSNIFGFMATTNAGRRAAFLLPSQAYGGKLLPRNLNL
jgi:hypothetical protein